MPESVIVGSSRLFAMASWIGAQPGQTTTVGALADHFGRTVKQVERDLDQLTFFRDSLPVESFELVWTPSPKGTREAARRDNPVTVLQAHGSSLPSVFTPETAAQTVIRLRAMAPALPEHVADILPATVMAIEAMAPESAGLSAIIEDASPSTGTLLRTLRQAVCDRQVVEFTYSKADGTRSQRRVEPCSLTRTSYGWSLQALDCDAGEHRHFTVGRIDALVLADQYFFAHPVCPAQNNPLIRVCVRPAAMWLVDDYGTLVDKCVDDTGQAVIIADIPVWNPSAVRDMLLSAGSAVVSIGDDAMRQAVHTHAAAGAEVWGQVLAQAGLRRDGGC